MLGGRNGIDCSREPNNRLVRYLNGSRTSNGPSTEHFELTFKKVELGLSLGVCEPLGFGKASYLSLVLWHLDCACFSLFGFVGCDIVLKLRKVQRIPIL